MKRKIVYLMGMVVCVLGLLVGCAGDSSAEVSLGDVMSKIEEGVTFPEGMVDITAADVERLYGIDSSMYTQFAGKVTTVGTVGDEVLIVEAAEGKASEIETLMKTRYDAKLQEMDGYLPEEHEKISNGEVLVSGNFVALLVASEQETLVDIFEGEVN